MPEAQRKPELGTRWTYKGNEYEVTDTEVEVKTEDGWVPGIAYKAVVDGYVLAEHGRKTYVRRLPDFLIKFAAL